MTQSEYAGEITRIIDEMTGHSFQYPETFESDVAACFLAHTPVEQAAEKLFEEWDQ